MRAILILAIACCLLLACGQSTTTSTTVTTATTPTTATTTTTTTAATTETTTATTTATTTTSTTPSTATTTPSTATTTPSTASTAIPGTDVNQSTISSNETATNQTPDTAPSTDVSSNTAGPPADTATTVPTTTVSWMCTSNPCGNVTCLQLDNYYSCRCPVNSVFNSSSLSCQSGDNFYGELTVTGKAFNSDPASKEYTDIYKYVVESFQKCFVKRAEFLGTTIVDMRETSSGNARNTPTVSVKVANIFSSNSITEATVKSDIDAYAKTETTFTTYTVKTLCSAGYYCDEATTTCTADSNGQTAICTCKAGYYSSQPVFSACRDCALDCSETNHKICKPGASPQCVCLAGYKLKGNACVGCDFGYSGDNCSDNFLLILVIVGAVLGAAVIALLGAVIGVSVRSRSRKSGERVELMDSDAQSGRDSPVPKSIFPKVQMKTDMGRENPASNAYDGEEEYQRSMPKRDYDESPWFEMQRNEMKRNY